MKEVRPMCGFVPVSIAATRSNYSESMIYKMIERDLVEALDFYGRKLINIEEVLEYKQQMQILGPAKYTPRQYREDDTNDEVESLPVPEDV